MNLTREQEQKAALARGDFHAYYIARYRGLTWSQVMEMEEYFDGETEIAAAHKATWREANKK